MAAKDDDRGRGAERPRDIPRAGWKDVAKRTWEEQGRDQLSIVAAGVAFFSLLAIFPAIAAFISIAGLIIDPAQIEQQLTTLDQFLPQQAQAILEDQIRQIAAEDTALGWGLALGLLGSLWSAGAGIKSLMQALNIVYEERERRSFFKLALLGLVFTIGAIILLLAVLVTVAVIPIVLEFVGLGGTAETLVNWLRWPLLAIILAAALAVLYRYGPCRARAKWRWLTPGAGLAVVLWVVASIAFSIYVRNFGNYNETYGSLGAVIVLMLWFWISSYIVLLGAELDAELEHQTNRDSTTGEPRPMGERGARMADTEGRRMG